MKKLLSLTVMAMAVVILSTGCAKQMVDNYLKDGSIKERISNVSDEKYLRTIGIGACDKASDNDTQRKAMSKNSAVANARYELLAVIKGLRLEGGIEVGKAIEKDDSIRERAERIVRGAEIIDFQWTKDDGCIVTLQLERAKIKDILAEDKYENPQQRLNYFEPEHKDISYGALVTGLIIPSGGLWYNGKCEEGLWMLCGIASCVGMAYMIDTDPYYKDYRYLKVVPIGLGIVLDLWSVIIGHRMENHLDDPKFSMEPTRDGMRLAYAVKFN